MEELYHTLHIAGLIAKSFQEELDDAEQKELEQWLATDENRRLYDSLHHRDLSERKREAQQINVQKHWREIKRRIAFSPRRSLRYWSRYAAVLLLPVLLAAAWLWWRQAPVNEHEILLAVSETPVPGSAKAILILSDGQQIDLTGRQDFRLHHNPEACLNNQDNTLTVEPADSAIVATAAVNYQTIAIPVTGEYKLVLPDSTQIWLNSATRLRFPTSFPGKERMVYLEGEAYFEVAPDKDRPFIVSVGELNVQVLGTKFNIKAYSEDAVIYTTLAEGAVKAIDTQKDVAMLLAPDQQCIFDKHTGKMDKKDVDAQAFIGWTTGKFIFKKETIEEILKQLGRWYGTTVTYQTPELKNYRFTGHVNRFDEISTLLQMIEKTYHIKFHVQGKHITVSNY
ncbi:MAG: DUF4974 domain-containing protein [Odoribacter sp.]|nr:DUF4974 domain-containing protein [Odoribacter sp.]